MGRRLPDRVGHEPADHAHARRALHDRGALPRPEGRRRLARLLRPRQVRRRLAARAAGHRRGAGHGDGPRDPQGVLGRPRRCRASRTTASASPTCRCSSRSTSATARYVPGRFLTAADIGDGERERRLEAGACSTPRPASRRCPTASVGFRYGEEGKGRWNLRPRRLDPVLTLHGRHDEAVEVALPRFDVGDGPRRRGDAPRRARDPRRRPARHDGARPDARHLRRRPRRAAGRLAGGLRRRRRAVHAGLAGGDHRRRPRDWRSRSPASSPATPRSAAGAR